MLSIHMMWGLIWAAYLVLPALILGCMVWRQAYRAFPFFFCYVIFSLISSAIEFRLRNGRYEDYFRAYWVADAIGVLLSLGVLWEILRNLLERYATLRPQTIRFLNWSTASLLFAGTVLSAAEPNLEDGTMIATIFLLERLARMVQAGLLTTLLFLGFLFRLRWSDRTLAIALGVGMYAAVSLAAVTAREYFGNDVAQFFSVITSVSEIFAMLIWLRAFWLPEKMRVEQPVMSLPQIENLNAAARELMQR